MGDPLEDFLPLKGVGKPDMPRRDRMGVLGGASPETWDGGDETPVMEEMDCVRGMSSERVRRDNEMTIWRWCCLETRKKY
jgi:hypothetical protein